MAARRRAEDAEEELCFARRDEAYSASMSGSLKRLDCSTSKSSSEQSMRDLPRALRSVSVKFH